MERIFLKDAAGIKAGSILDLDWDFFRASAKTHHGLEAPLDSYALPVDEAARRYVAGLTVKDTKAARSSEAESRRTD